MKELRPKMYLIQLPTVLPSLSCDFIDSWVHLLFWYLHHKQRSKKYLVHAAWEELLRLYLWSSKSPLKINMTLHCYHCEWYLQTYFKSTYSKSETVSVLIWNHKATVACNAHHTENNTVSEGEFTWYLERMTSAKEEPRITNMHVTQWTVTKTGSSWIEWRMESCSFSLDSGGFDISSGINKNFMTNSFSYF